MTVEPGQLIKGVKGRFIGDFQTQRQMTPEGFLVAPARIARTGVQSYRASELGLPGVDANKIIRLHRPSEEVFAPEAIASFEAQTVTDNHPAGAVTSGNWPDLARGDVHGVGSDGEYLCAQKVIVRAQDAINKVQSGKAQLSCGYVFDVDMTPGTTADGVPYDGVQRNIRGNHVAIVQAGRAGPNVRIADGTEGVRKMIRAIKIGDSQFNLELDDNTAQFINDAVNRHDRAMDDAKRGLKDANTALKEAQEAHGTLQKAHDGLQKENDGLKTKLNAFEDSAKDDEDDDEDDEEEGMDSKKKGSDSAEKVKISAIDRYKRSVQRAKKLKAQLPTADQMHAAVAALAQTIGDAKAIVGDAVDPKGKSVVAIRSAVLGHVLAKDAALKPFVVAIVGEDVSKSGEKDIEKAFGAVLVASKMKGGGTRGADESARQREIAARDAAIALGQRINDDGRNNHDTGVKPVQMGGRSTWLAGQATQSGGAE